MRYLRSPLTLVVLTFVSAFIPVAAAAQISFPSAATSLKSVLITYNSTPAAAGDTVVLFTGASEAACFTGTYANFDTATGNLLSANPSLLTLKAAPTAGTFLCGYIVHSGLPVTLAPVQVPSGPPAPTAISPVPVATDTTLTVVTGGANAAASNDAVAFYQGETNGKCLTKATPVVLTDTSVVLGATSPTTFHLSSPLAAGTVVCGVVVHNNNYVPIPAVTVGPAPGTPVKSSDGSEGCIDTSFNDCHWGFTAVGGVEQSALSSQDSQTDGFIEAFIHGPLYHPYGDAWLAIRFLGSPTPSDTQNIVTTATNPTGSVTSSSLSSVGYAIDYVAGYERTFHDGHAFTYAPIVGFGATTTLSAQNPTIAFVVPAFGSNECTQLHSRFGTGNTKSPYNPPLPDSGPITITTTTGTNAPVVTMTNYCVANMTPTSTSTTVNGITTTTAATGTPITDIAFSPVDRSSFLLKWVAGVRFINRYSRDGTKTSCAEDTTAFTDDCNRSIIDFTLGQDEAITGGMLRHLVLKSNAIFRIPKSNVYVFLSASNRLEKNVNLPPLILAPAPIATAASTSAAGAVVIPSPSVFVLPLRQPDRDFYRVGIALDLGQVLSKLF